MGVLTEVLGWYCGGWLVVAAAATKSDTQKTAHNLRTETSSVQVRYRNVSYRIYYRNVCIPHPGRLSGLPGSQMA